MGLERRAPVHVRPLLFFAGWIALVLGVFLGLNWAWTVQNFQGSVLIQILLPGQLLHLGRPEAAWFLLALAGLALLVASVGSSDSRSTGLLRAPWMSFFPSVFALGLFLVVFGCIYLFDLSVTSDRTLNGFALFVNFNYAGLDKRVLTSIFGFLVLAVGFVMFTVGAFSAGRVRREKGLGGRPVPAPSMPVGE